MFNRKPSKDLTQVQEASSNFFFTAGGRLSGENLRKHASPFIYSLVCGVSEEEINQKKGVMICLLTQLFWGAEASNLNWKVGEKFISMLRSTIPDVTAGKMTTDQAVAWAYENRKEAKESRSTLDIDTLDDNAVKELYAALAARINPSQEPVKKGK